MLWAQLLPAGTCLTPQLLPTLSRGAVQEGCTLDGSHQGLRVLAGGHQGCHRSGCIGSHGCQWPVWGEQSCGD